MFDILERPAPEIGNTLDYHAFTGEGGYYEGFIKTPHCFVQAYSMQSTTPFGWMSTNFNGRYYQINFEDAPTRLALIRRAHAMMRQIANEHAK